LTLNWDALVFPGNGQATIAAAEVLPLARFLFFAQGLAERPPREFPIDGVKQATVGLIFGNHGIATFARRPSV
jgi:hypothetical protein